MNLHLTGYSLMVSDWKNRITVTTGWNDKTKVTRRELKNPPPMLVTFCPFCGKRASSGKRAKHIDRTSKLLTALEAITARIQGEWDNPALVAFGALSTTDEDVLAIARAAMS